MKGNPLVSIISVNWNQSEMTHQMVKSLKEMTYDNVEIIIVDNGSTKGDLTPIKEEFADVKILRSEKNLGFAGGNNIAFEQAQGKYILLLNNDTEVEHCLLEPIVGLMEEDDSIGIVSPKICFYDEPNRIQYAGASSINPITSRGVKYGHKQEDTGEFTHIKQTDLANGACMMVRKDVIDQVGGLYEHYFLYYEEHDFCERAKKAGYKIYYCGVSNIYHKVSASTGQLSALKTYYLNRNRLLFLRRNVTGLIYWVSVLYYLMIAAPKQLASFVLKFRFGHVKALGKALWWNLFEDTLVPSSLSAKTS